ncbi:MAG: hypothetical protein QG657_2539 [Acidobacteriota bacterium]|nr:hypothetical protein [Acidobacteriota bacterium]
MENILFYTAAAAALIALLYIYSTFTQKYVGGSDWYGYYQQSLLMKSGRVSLETDLPAAKYPSIAPLSFYAINGKVVGQYPPGFPLLMAIAGFVGLEFYVNPMLGVISVILMFLTIFTLTGNDKWTAGLFALLWGFFPLTVYGSTYVMSDLPATFFILLAFYLLKTKKLIPSALALAFSLAVRPTNVLFCVVFLPFAYKELNIKQRFQYGAWLAAATSLYAIYNWVVYGAPWKTGYLDISHNLSTTIFARNLRFYSWEGLVQFTPLLLLLALFALWKKEKHAFFFAAWFLVFLLFYCFWASLVDFWWWLRFLLPAFPALFLLAALGFKRILTALRLHNHILKHAGTVLVVALVLSTGIYFIYRGNHYLELWDKGKGKLFYIISKKVAKEIVPGSLVGSCDFSGPLRIYANIESFGSFHMNSLLLVSDMLKEGKPVYVAVEPWQRETPGIKGIFDNFKVRRITDVGTESWPGFYLYRILSQKYQVLKVPPL